MQLTFRWNSVHILQAPDFHILHIENSDQISKVMVESWTKFFKK